ncbi:9655_t:CDS:1, partial [Gigaspora rosea]
EISNQREQKLEQLGHRKKQTRAIFTMFMKTFQEIVILDTQISKTILIYCIRPL